MGRLARGRRVRQGGRRPLAGGPRRVGHGRGDGEGRGGTRDGLLHDPTRGPGRGL